MSFAYRKKKRILAHHLLSELHNRIELHLKDNTVTLAMDLFESETFIKKIEDPAMTFILVNLLMENNHISWDNELKGYHYKIIPNGVDAYKSSFYIKEIEKDRLESIELYTKWLVPIGSFIISIVALLISIGKK